MTRVVFISYSHDSEAHRERVLGLSERLRADGIETRLDQYVEGTPAEGWPRWMQGRLDEADFVLVVCTETYYRRFRGREEPGKGKGVDWEGALITQELYHAKSRSTKFVPVLFAGDDEPFIPEPLRGGTWYPLTSEAGYGALQDVLLGQAGVEPGEVVEARTRPRRRGTPLAFDEAQRIAPSKLKHAAATLFGREEELARLDAAWDNPSTHVVTLVAWGGVGKTSLVARWAAGLAGRDFDGADYFDWSFYSQGTVDHLRASGATRGGGASADVFVASALKFFGDAEMAKSAASPWDGLLQACRDVEERAAKTVEWVESAGKDLLSAALDHLTLGRAGLYRTILERPDPADHLEESAVEEPRSEIEQAVDGLRRGGRLDHLPRGLLTRAWLRALTGDRDGARRDLDEAWSIAERGPMPLYQADVQLHRARLFGDRTALAEARRLIDKHGYERRREELEDAEALPPSIRGATPAADRWR